MSITVAELYHYPVKGLSAERLDRVAIAHGSTQFDPATPQWQPKTNFLMLMRDEKLARLRVRFEEQSGMLAIERAGKQVVRAKASEALGRTLIGQFFASFLGPAARGTPKLLEAPGHMFSDSRHKYVSIINLASVRDLERVVRQKVHPLRFRANVYLEGAPAWQEFDWVGQEVGLGSAGLRIAAPIERCAATNVNPETAARDLNIPLSLQRGFGHVNMGVYGEVIAGGEIAAGDSLTPPA